MFQAEGSFPGKCTEYNMMTPHQWVMIGHCSHLTRSTQFISTVVLCGCVARIASTSSVSMALRDYGSKVCEAADIQVRTNLEPWPWVFHAGPDKMRWHVLKGLIKDYQLQQPRLVEIGVERGNLSEQLLEVWLEV